MAAHYYVSALPGPVVKIIDACIVAGVQTDWFLFASDCLRISPPLIISEKQIRKASEVIVKACNI